MNEFELIAAYNDVILDNYQYQTQYSSGIDLCLYFDISDIDEVMHWSQDDKDRLYVIVHPHTSFLANTGLRIKFNNKNLEGQIRSRSGLALKTGLFVLNAPGTIDADYAGIIKVIIFNPTAHPIQIYAGDRIAQLVISPVVRNEDYIKHKERGEGGFGSTGSNS